MKKRSFYSFFVAGMIMLATGSFVSCEEDMTNQVTTIPITIVPDNSEFVDGTVARTRGTKVTAISGLGISASVYSAASTYTSAGCGSFFFNESVTAGTPTAHYWPTSDYRLSFFGYYPYGNAALTVQSAASATGAPTYAYTVPSAIASQLDVMTGQTTDVLGGGTSAVSMTMKHRCAAIRFSVTNSRSSAITLTSISIEGVKYTGTLNEDTWTLSSSVNSSSSNPFTLSYGSTIAASATSDVTGTTNIFLMLPQAIPVGANVKAVVDGDEFEAAIDGSWVAGKQYNYSIEVTNSTIIVVDEETDIENWVEQIIDLSMVDNAGNKRASMTTANCYLVHAEGDYRIPLVYGNAIKNGEDNVIAYYPGKDGSITNGIDRFINHNGDGITGPWITKSGSGVDAGMGLTAASAELLWQDATSLISAVSVDGDYLYFTVGTFNPGNALIAVKDGNGNILWSWHIWATEDNLSNTTVISTGSHDYTVAPVNVGWVSTGGDGKQGYCPYYQWGRKDPFPPNHTVYNISNNSVGYTYERNSSITIADNIKKPTYFYKNTSGDGPVATSYLNMWDAQNTLQDSDLPTAVKKTIYDPCPPDFCMPTRKFYSYIVTNKSSYYDWDDTNKGRIWSKDSPNVFFPASGWRDDANGVIYRFNENAHYWSAMPAGNNGISFQLNPVNMYSSYRSYGYSVRPVAEE